VGALNLGELASGEIYQNPIEAAKYGIKLRDAGNNDAAESVFLSLTRDYPEKLFGWQELGLLYSRSGRSDEAQKMFRAALNVAPRDFLPRTHFATHLTLLGRHSDAEAVLAEHDQSSVVEAGKVRRFREFLLYLRAWPKMDALASANGLERNGLFDTCAEVEARIFQAIDRKDPFSLVRLGDGEGAWFKLSATDESSYPWLYSSNRREFLRIWFNDDTIHDRQSFHDMAVLMLDDLQTTDVLGIPYSLRINHEYQIGSSRGIPSVRNILRWLDSTPRQANQRFCSQDIHLELQHSGFFHRLFSKTCQWGVISCHPGLPALIQARTGAVIQFSHLVPEEKGSIGVLGSNSVRRGHFPMIYEEIISDLRSVSQQGRVWLVAAGILGKRYCAEIRAQGGVALDVGSIVDGWLGKATRPTFRVMSEFAL
jgi:hypothetical protein